MRTETFFKADKTTPKTITNAKHPKFDGKEGRPAIEIPQIVPQFDSLQEAINSAGGEDDLVAYINDSVRKDAIVIARTFDGGAGATIEGVVTKVTDILKNLTIKILRTPSAATGRLKNKDKATLFDQAQALMAEGKTQEAIELLKGVNA
jgi:hypothetical protein